MRESGEHKISNNTAQLKQIYRKHRPYKDNISLEECCTIQVSSALFINKRFALKKMFQQIVSKFLPNECSGLCWHRDQGFPQGKDVKLHEMKKKIKQHGFSYTNIANY